MTKKMAANVAMPPALFRVIAPMHTREGVRAGRCSGQEGSGMVDRLRQPAFTPPRRALRNGGAC